MLTYEKENLFKNEVRIVNYQSSFSSREKAVEVVLLGWIGYATGTILGTGPGAGLRSLHHISYP